MGSPIDDIFNSVQAAYDKSQAQIYQELENKAQNLIVKAGNQLTNTIAGNNTAPNPNAQQTPVVTQTVPVVPAASSSSIVNSGSIMPLLLIAGGAFLIFKMLKKK